MSLSTLVSKQKVNLGITKISKHDWFINQNSINIWKKHFNFIKYLLNAIQRVPISKYSSEYKYTPRPSFFLGKLFLLKTPPNLFSFLKYLWILKFDKGCSCEIFLLLLKHFYLLLLLCYQSGNFWVLPPRVQEVTFLKILLFAF